MLSGRNLALWSGYSGLDPEVNGYSNNQLRGSGNAAQFVRVDAYSWPMIRRYTFHVTATSRERSLFMSDIPGMAEAGLPAYDLSSWYGLFLPAGTPAAVVTSVFNAATKAVQQPEVKAVLQRDGNEMLRSKSPQDFTTYLAHDTKFWVQLVKQSGITTN